MNLPQEIRDRITLARHARSLGLMSALNFHLAQIRMLRAAR